MGRKMTEEDMEVDGQANGDQENEKSEKSKYEDKVKFVSAIAQPLASKKFNKKLLKLLRSVKSQNDKTLLILGLKDAQRWIRKNELKKGETVLVIFAGDVTPVDVMCHMPAVCEEKNIPYVYIASRQDLAHAVGFQNSCLMALVREHSKYKELYDECYQEAKKLGHVM
ncbi:H/ACA ribonucleoprotein complex subunit 2-like protein [Macrosteles quadrilineatus]|uniref:H/ACA ribonucleoprotein complex subunit 2-like protein n=1 Tax=Macrosteles quadrilineatus TaxID=74068 RepID=UPI0023E2ADDF|nr:H/ACA ribonucleoprotein complex subunit 2-like protein [Macrosteles quadrilineatus]